MKRYLLLLLLGLGTFSGLQAQDLSYYLPDSLTYSAEIPKPSEIIGHRVGERHVTHDRLVLYMQEIARRSDRITIEKTGAICHCASCEAGLIHQRFLPLLDTKTCPPKPL